MMVVSSFSPQRYDDARLKADVFGGEENFDKIPSISTLESSEQVYQELCKQGMLRVSYPARICKWATKSENTLFSTQENKETVPEVEERWHTVTRQDVYLCTEGGRLLLFRKGHLGEGQFWHVASIESDGTKSYFLPNFMANQEAQFRRVEQLDGEDFQMIAAIVKARFAKPKCMEQFVKTLCTIL